MKPIVLIVDDDPDDRALTLRVLHRLSLDVTCVEVGSGEAALAYLSTSEHLPAVTVMDLKMPGMGGFETLQRIRADVRLARLPVVIVTNSGLDSDRADALAAGADDFLHKALDLKCYAGDIGARLRRWVK